MQESSSVDRYDQTHDVFESPGSTFRASSQVTEAPSPKHDRQITEGNLKSTENIQNLDGPDINVNKESGDRPSIHKRFENIKSWSLTTIKCTKQVIEEKLGTTTPTCDQQLDLRIESVRQMQKHYRLLLDYIRQFSTNFAKAVQCQRQMSGHLATLAQQQLELTEEFTVNSETQRIIAQNGERLLSALDSLCDSLGTLINRTFEDTLLTIKGMNSARVEYDAYRKDVEALKAQPRRPSSNNIRHAEEAANRFHTSEEHFFNMKTAVDAKLRLLNENRIRVMQHQLLLLHKATSAYFTGNNDKLEATLKQFNVKMKTLNSGTKSWLERSRTMDSSNHDYVNMGPESAAKVNGHNGQSTAQ